VKLANNRDLALTEAVAFLSYYTEEPIRATPALIALAEGYVAAFREGGNGSAPRGAHPLPAMGVILDFSHATVRLH